MQRTQSDSLGGVSWPVSARHRRDVRFYNPTASRKLFLPGCGMLRSPFPLEDSMDEEEFDSWLQSRPFTREDVTTEEARWRRSTTLALALWGRTPGDLQRQLLAPYPEIPTGFDLEDFHDLQRRAQLLSASISDPRNALSRLAFSSQTIFVGTQRYTGTEARCEIVRRA